jgi:hypothetical protein
LGNATGLKSLLSENGTASKAGFFYRWKIVPSPLWYPVPYEDISLCSEGLLFESVDSLGLEIKTQKFTCSSCINYSYYPWS